MIQEISDALFIPGNLSKLIRADIIKNLNNMTEEKLIEILDILAT